MTAGTMAFRERPDPQVGGPKANVTGEFGPVVAWPIIPLHVVLLPGGRVMNYGTGSSGQQGAEFIYDVWTPSLGTGTNAHLVLPNTTSTDIFCSSQSVMCNGNVLTTGGDLTVDGQRNFANNKTTIFRRTTNTIASNTPMQYPRWYPSLVALPDGRLAVFGGYQNVVPPLNDPIIAAVTPEVYDPATHVWTTLTERPAMPLSAIARMGARIGIIPGPMLRLAVIYSSLAMMARCTPSQPLAWAA